MKIKGMQETKKKAEMQKTRVMQILFLLFPDVPFGLCQTAASCA